MRLDDMQNPDNELLMEELKRIEAENENLRKQVNEIYSAFFEKPAMGDKPIYDMIIDVVRQWERAKWGVRVVIWGLGFLAALGAAVASIRGLGGK